MLEPTTHTLENLLKGGFVTLACLQIFVQKGACLLVPLGLRKAIKKHLLVLSTSSTTIHRGMKLLRCNGSRFSTTTSTHTSHNRSNGLMSNGGSCSKCHTRHNSRSNSRQHTAATRLLLHGRSWCRRTRSRS